MKLYKNTAGQKLAVLAIDTSDGSLKTGDAANITAQISKDGGASAASDDTNPTELDATNHPGVYIFDLTQAETNADMISFTAGSSTGNISLGDPMIIYTQDRPLDDANTELASAPGVTGSLRQLIQFAAAKGGIQKVDANRTTGKETVYKNDGATQLSQADIADDGTTTSRTAHS